MKNEEQQELNKCICIKQTVDRDAPQFPVQTRTTVSQDASAAAFSYFFHSKKTSLRGHLIHRFRGREFYALLFVRMKLTKATTFEKKRKSDY